MKFTKHSVLILCLAVFTGCKTEDILDTSETETICYEDTFSIQLNADYCKVDIEQELASSSLYQEELSINRVIIPIIFQTTGWVNSQIQETLTP